MQKLKISSLADIEAFEQTPVEERLNFFNTYDLLKHGTATDPAATAISFFLSGDQYDQPMTVSYAELLSNVTRTANLFHDLGVGPKDVVSYLLPNLPHTHPSAHVPNKNGNASDKNDISARPPPHAKEEACIELIYIINQII